MGLDNLKNEQSDSIDYVLSSPSWFRYTIKEFLYLATLTSVGLSVSSWMEYSFLPNKFPEAFRIALYSPSLGIPVLDYILSRTRG